MTDDFDDLDRRLRELAHAARAEVAVPAADTEAALADVTSGTHVARLRPVPEPRRAWRAWAAAAAATVLVAGAGVYFLARGDDRISTVDSTVPDTIATTPPGETVTGTTPATTPPTTPSTSPSTSTPATDPPSDSIPVRSPWDRLTRVPTGIERTCVGEWNCTRLFADPDDVVYACDPVTNALTRYGNETLSAQLPNCQVVAVGPARVAYVLSDGYEYDDGATGYDLIAISMADEDAGTELFRWPPWDPVDTELVPTPVGLASVSFLSGDPQPNLAQLVAFEWVLPDPADAREFPVGVYEPGDAPAIVVGERRWPIGEHIGTAIYGMPSIVATDDGGFLALVTGDEFEVTLVRGTSDGGAHSVPLGSRPSVVIPEVLERSGTVIVPNGDTFVRIDPLELFTLTTEPPTTTMPPEAVPEANPVLAGLNYEYSGIDRTCREDWECTRVVFDPYGAPVSFDPTTGTIRREIADRDTGAVAEFDLGSFGAGTWLVAAGPNDVVYVAEPAGPETSDVVAYSLTAGDVGREIKRYTDAIGIGDYDIVPQPGGLVINGWYGQGMQPPDPSDVAIAWVGLDGQPTVSTQPQIRSDYYAITIEIGDRTWAIEDPVVGAHPSWPRIVPTFDGGFVAVYFHGADGSTAVVRGWADGTADVWRPPPGTDDTWLEPYPDPSGGILVPNGDWFARAELFSHREADYWMGQQGTGTDDEFVEFLDTNDPWWEHDLVGFANAVAGPPGWPGERRSIRIDVDNEPLAIVTREGLGDDSVAATQLRFFFTDTHSADLRVDRIEWAQRCQPDRGHEDFQPTACI